MGKFIAMSMFIGCIFFAGMFFGATMTENQASNEIEPISSMYEEWKAEKQSEEQIQPTIEQNDRENIFSKTAKTFADKLKSVARTIVFHVISIIEKAFGL